MVPKRFQSDTEFFRFRSFVDRQVEEIDKPNQGILVHGIKVSQLHDSEEKYP